MRGKDVRFSQWLNVWFYGVFSVLFFSGVIWLVVHNAGTVGTEGEGFDGQVSPLLLKIHGAAAMGSLVILGVLIPSHMQRAWQLKRNHFPTVAIVGLCLLMAISGYGLYYCGSDAWRAWISGFHSVAGCALPLVLVWHIFSGRKRK